ncbi:MAG: BlaI/MecI/CopY family transcriptional regulator [Armatimonadetes bacterium]|jgi:predicted transcriptional regulator|nr:BlaI/MecI/CopY family transcriptional regulator [Armatimonadota bacterium]
MQPFRRFTPGKTGDASPLGHLEAAVMEAVWSLAGPAPVGDVHAALAGDAQVAYNTIKTTMERLADKGILSREKEGKAYRYTALVSREDLERRIVSATLDRLVQQFPQAVASFFVQPATGLSDEKLALLQDAVERRAEADDA